MLIPDAGKNVEFTAFGIDLKEANGLDVPSSSMMSEMARNWQRCSRFEPKAVSTILSRNWF